MHANARARAFAHAALFLACLGCCLSSCGEEAAAPARSGGAPAASVRATAGAARAAGCAPSANSARFTSTRAQDFSWKNFGHYNLSLDDWGPDPGTLSQWARDAGCWGVSTTTAAESGGIHSYANVSRGWSNNAGLMQALSAPGAPQAPDWTRSSGLGIRVAELRKAHVKWSMVVPTTPNAGNRASRWDALIDVYFHAQPAPPPSAFPPLVDLQIMQMLMDQPMDWQAPRSSGYFAWVLDHNHAFVKTLGGVTYVGAIDTAKYHQPGGHTVTLMTTPTQFNDPQPGAAGTLWGQASVLHDLRAIVSWLGEDEPKDDVGHVIRYASGAVVHEPLIAPEAYLTSVNAGFEVDFGTAPDDNQWTTTGFWVAVQDEADGP